MIIVHDYHIIFVCMGWRISYERFQAIMSLFGFLPTYLSFRSLLFTSFHVLVGRPLGKLPLNLNAPHLLD